MAGARHGGAEAFFERLTIAFGRAGVAQRVVIRREPARAALLRAHGIEPVELDFGGAFDFRTRPALKREIAAFAPDVVMSWMSRAARAAPKGDFVHIGRLGGYYDLKYYRSCDHLIGNTEDIRDWIVAQGWPRDRAHHVPNFVDAESQPPADRAQHATPKDAPLLLALGRLHENKAFDVLIDALARVPGAHLWIAGEGPLDALLRQRAKRVGVSPRVHFLGWRRDAPALLAAADVLVCPSRAEPLGNVVIEGWAHRRPVVAAAAKGPAALIADGRTGLLAPVDDPDALAQAIQRVLADKALRESLASEGRKAYEASFTERAVVARYLDVFQRVTNGGS
jgi:glycosyltransferase involved in cell wall biosynthesis